MTKRGEPNADVRARDEPNVDVLANAFGPEFAAMLQAEMAGSPGTGTGATIAPQELTIDQLLVDTAMTVTGRQAVTGLPFMGGMPSWAVDAYAKGAFDNPDLDPYLGLVSQPGDERVYLGRHGTKVPVSFEEWDDQFDVNTKDLKDREENRAANQRADQANKVERQVRKAAAAYMLRDRVGDRFDGIVTGASQKGTWVRIFHPPTEGKVVRGWDGLDIGDRVKVKLLGVDVERGFIDFGRA